jgi:hypothetical protein
MPYKKLALPRLKVLVAKVTETLSKGRVSSTRVCVGGCTGIIESSKDPRRTFLLDQITDNFVIKVLNWRPFNLLSRIFLLFGFEGELNEDLLRISGVKRDCVT